MCSSLTAVRTGPTAQPVQGQGLEIKYIIKARVKLSSVIHNRIMQQSRLCSNFLPNSTGSPKGPIHIGFTCLSICLFVM